MWYLVSGFAGSLVGIVICALCTASRVAEVESRVDALRLQNRWLESLLRRGQGRRADQWPAIQAALEECVGADETGGEGVR